MSETHTPGPWFIDEDQRPNMQWNRHIYGPDGLAICFMAHSDGKATDRDEANAALIARAPDLAAEVERLRDDLRNLHLVALGRLTLLDAERRKVEVLRGALNAMLTHMGMDEDEWNKPTFDQARAALAATEQKGGA